MNSNIPRAHSLTVLQIAAFFIVIAGIILAKSIIASFLIALFISIICAQPILWLEKKKVPKGLAVLIVLIGVLVVVFGFGFLIGNAISSFTSNASNYEINLKSITDTLINFLKTNGINVTKDQFPNLSDPSRILKFAAQAINELVNTMGNTFLVILTTMFMLMELSSLSDKIKVVFQGPADSISHLIKIINSIRRYLGIKTIFAIAHVIVLYIALKIVGLDNAILWALIAGLMSYIPHIGSIIASIPAVLFAFIQLGIGGAFWTMITYIVANNILGNFLEPKIMGRGVSLSTLVVFLSLIFWRFVLGTAGMFLAVPLTITIKIILEHNENTKWIAILLGTPKEAKDHIDTSMKPDGRKRIKT